VASRAHNFRPGMASTTLSNRRAAGPTFAEVFPAIIGTEYGYDHKPCRYSTLSPSVFVLFPDPPPPGSDKPWVCPDGSVDQSRLLGRTSLFVLPPACPFACAVGPLRESLWPGAVDATLVRFAPRHGSHLTPRRPYGARMTAHGGPCADTTQPDCRAQHQLIAVHLAGLAPGAFFSDCGVARVTGTPRHAMFLLWQLCQDGYIDSVPGTDRLYRNVRIPTATYDRLRPILRLPSTAPRPVDVSKKLRRKRPCRHSGHAKTPKGPPARRRKRASTDTGDTDTSPP
jgi:hypothetical protein